MFSSKRWVYNCSAKEASDLLSHSNWGTSNSLLLAASKYSEIGFILLWVLLVAGESYFCWIDELDLERITILTQINAILPAAIVGAVIPFLVLLTQLAQSARQPTLRSLTTTTIQRKTIIVPLSALTVCVLFGLAGTVYRDFDVHPNTRPLLRYLVLTAWYLSALSLWLCISFVHQATKALSPVSMRRSLATAMRRAARASLMSDISYRIANTRVAEAFEALGIDRFAINHYGRKRVESERDGVVVDLNLTEIEKLANLLSAASDKDAPANSRMSISVRFGSRIGKGETIALLPDLLDNPEVSETRLRSAIKISDTTTRDNEILRRTLEDFKLELFAAVDTCSENDVRSLFDVYSEVLESYMGLKISSSAEIAQSWFEAWTLLRMLESDFTDILRRALAVRDKTFITSPLYECKRILILALDHKDIMVFETILRVFIRCFIESQDAQNKRGIDRSTSYLTELVDFGIASRIDKTPHSGVAIFIPFLESIRRTLEEILRYSILLDDIKTSKRIWNSFDRMLEFVHINAYEELLTNKDDEAKALKALREFKDCHDTYAGDTRRSVLSFVLDLVDEERLPSSSAVGYFSVFAKNMSPETILGWATKLHTTRDFPARWSYEEIRRGVRSIDESVGPARVCVIIALRTQKGNEEPIDLGPSRFAHDKSDLLCKMAEAAVDRWDWALPGIANRDVENVVSSFKSSADQFKEQVNKEIATSELSGKLRDDFIREALEEYGTGGSLRTVLDQHGCVSTDPGTAGQLLVSSQLEPKEMFIEQDRVHYVQFGAAHIRGLAEAETDYLLKSLSTHDDLSQTVSSGSVGDLCDLALRSLRESGYSPDILFISHDLFRRTDLFRLEKFEPSNREDQCIPGTVGKYDNAWVCRTSSISGHSVLALDASHVYSVTEGSPTPDIEIRDLTTVEITRFAEDEAYSQDPALSVVLRIQKTVCANIVDPHAAILVTC